MDQITNRVNELVKVKPKNASIIWQCLKSELAIDDFEKFGEWKMPMIVKILLKIGGTKLEAMPLRQ